MKFLLLPALATVILTPLALDAAGKPAPAAPDASPAPKSVFVIDPQFGKDPFFPKTKRWEQLLPKPEDPILVPAPPAFPDEIRFQGIAGTPARRLVIINGKTMAKNEKADFRLPSGQTVKATCVNIKESSVILEINGVTKELRSSFK